MSVLSISHVKIMFTGIYQECRNWYGNAGNPPRLVLCEDKTLVATVGPSELLHPPGSTLLWSITQIKVL